MQFRRRDTNASVGGFVRDRGDGSLAVEQPAFWIVGFSIVGAATVATGRAAGWFETRMVVAACLALITAVVLSIMWRSLRQIRRLDAVVNNVPQAVLLFDPAHRLAIKNKHCADLFGSSGIWIGRRFDDIEADFHGIQDESGLGSYCETVRGALSEARQTQSTIATPSGRMLQIVNQPLRAGGWISTIEEATTLCRSVEITEIFAGYDQLTRLPNRASFFEYLRRQIAAPGHPNGFAVLFLDLDEFKVVNDTLGHHIGDQLLLSVADRLRSCLAPPEFVARLGGDEFAFVSGPVINNRTVVELIERIYSAIRVQHQCGGHFLTIDGSIGIAMTTMYGGTCESILQSADLAMYAAKAEGKKTYKFFELEMEAKARNRLLLETDLRQALTYEQVEVCFQPILDLRTRSLAGFEALARWRHYAQGPISPATFIPIAEQAGLIDQLGDSILRQACHEAAKWPANLSVAVNVSPLQLKSADFGRRVIAIVSEAGLPPDRLELEITEAVLISDSASALDSLHELRKIGIKIALDDFGTGYSSLSYLLRFPFDKIKIDKSFVEGLTERDISKGIVKAVITMATEQGMTTTAEGVENESQREILSKLGCHQIQGYLISAAVAKDRIDHIAARFSHSNISRATTVSPPFANRQL